MLPKKHHTTKQVSDHLKSTIATRKHTGAEKRLYAVEVVDQTVGAKATFTKLQFWGITDEFLWCSDCGTFKIVAEEL